MKKVLLAVTLALAANVAQAALVFSSGGTTAATNAINDFTGGAIGTTYQFGTLSAAVSNTIRFTFLGGVEAGWTNLFVNGMNVINNKSAVGSTFDFVTTSAGPLSFRFVSQDGFIDNNGSANIAVLQNFGVHQFVLMLDDNHQGKHTDFDDHIIGVSQVPVPAALPLMASALGMFGVARRRKTLV